MPGRFTAEQIFRGLLRGPLTTRTSSTPPASPGTAWAGVVSSLATATGSVATTLVDSDSLIFLTLGGATSVTSSAGRAIIVSSISPGSGFFLATSDGTVPPTAYNVYWFIVRTQ